MLWRECGELWEVVIDCNQLGLFGGMGAMTLELVPRLNRETAVHTSDAVLTLH